MKTFFGDGPGSGTEQAPTCPGAAAAEQAFARIAVYDGLVSPPRVEDISESDLGEAVDALAARTYELAREHGGRVPYSLIREIAENLLHAHFSEVVVTIMDDGNTVRFSDRGPGIADKERAFEPGFSTATRDMKRYIRGVGSGLPIVRECISYSSGTVVVEDNLAGGTVVTLRVEPPPAEPAPAAEEHVGDPVPRLSLRQKQVLSLVMELGSVGPSLVSGELSVAVSTAYRDLETLESLGLLTSASRGKRALTDLGVSCLDSLSS